MSYTALAAVQAYHDWDFRAAEATLRQGLVRSRATRCSMDGSRLLLAIVGRLREAIVEAEAARDLEPSDAGAAHDPRHRSLLRARFRRGICARCAGLLPISPNYGPAFFGSRPRPVGRWADTTKPSRSMQAGNRTFVASRAIRAGWPDSALATHIPADDSEIEKRLGQLTQLETVGTFVSIDNYAYIAANQGRIDEAFRLLDEAVDRKMTNVLWLAVDPRADALRKDLAV